MLQLGYSSVLFGKQRIVHLQGVRVGRPSKRGLKGLGFLLSSVCLLPLSLPHVNWASQEGFVSPEVLTLVLRFSFVPFLWAFSFLCLLATAILDSFFLF